MGYYGSIKWEHLNSIDSIIPSLINYSSSLKNIDTYYNTFNKKILPNLPASLQNSNELKTVLKSIDLIEEEKVSSENKENIKQLFEYFSAISKDKYILIFKDKLPNYQKYFLKTSTLIYQWYSRSLLANASSIFNVNFLKITSESQALMGLDFTKDYNALITKIITKNNDLINKSSREVITLPNGYEKDFDKVLDSIIEDVSKLAYLKNNFPTNEKYFNRHLVLSNAFRNVISALLFYKKLEAILPLGKSHTLARPYFKAIKNLSKIDYDILSGQKTSMDDLIDDYNYYEGKLITINGFIENIEIRHVRTKAISIVKIKSNKGKTIEAVLPHVKIDSCGAVKGSYIKVSGIWKNINTENKNKQSLSIGKSKLSATSKDNFWSWMLLNINDIYTPSSHNTAIEWTLESGANGACNQILYDVFAMPFKVENMYGTKYSATQNFRSAVPNKTARSANSNMRVAADDTPNFDDLPPDDVKNQEIEENIKKAEYELNILKEKIQEYDKLTKERGDFNYLLYIALFVFISFIAAIIFGSAVGLTVLIISAVILIAKAIHDLIKYFLYQFNVPFIEIHKRINELENKINELKMELYENKLKLSDYYNSLFDLELADEDLNMDCKGLNLCEERPETTPMPPLIPIVDLIA